MQKAITWVLDGEINEDAGDIGGDIQVGPAVSVRFRSDQQPDARFEIALYATAQEYVALDEDAPDCPHPMVLLENHGDGTGRFAPMPPEHIACSYKAGTVDVQSQCTYMTGGTVKDGGYESDGSEEIVYEWEGADMGYGDGSNMPEDIRRATADALARVKNWTSSINAYLHWDGVSRING